MSHDHPGDPVRLGTCIGWGNEPGERWGRLVGIVKAEVPGIHGYVIRTYAADDGDWPTGQYRTTSFIGLVPHQPAGPCAEAGVLDGWVLA